MILYNYTTSCTPYVCHTTAHHTPHRHTTPPHHSTPPQHTTTAQHTTPHHTPPQHTTTTHHHTTHTTPHTPPHTITQAYCKMPFCWNLSCVVLMITLGKKIRDRRLRDSLPPPCLFPLFSLPLYPSFPPFLLPFFPRSWVFDKGFSSVAEADLEFNV